MVSTRAALALLLAGAMQALPAAAARERDLMLEAQLEPARGYVQAQAIYRLRFYQAVDVRDLKITAPALRLADIEPIGDARVYETLRGGRRYRVHERSYAVFPFSSGALELSGAYATARVAHAGTTGDGRRSVRIDAAAQTLTVLPATGTEAWLPARSVSMSEAWSPAADGLRAGHPHQRTIRIEAAGVRAEQIPEPRIGADGMTVHAGPARLENRFEGELHVGVREQTFSMVPLRAGDIALSALQLPWWNVGTASAASAGLAARSMHVSGGDAAPAASPQPITMPWRVPAMAVALLAAFLLAACWCRARIACAWRLHWYCRQGDARAVRNELLAQASAAWPSAPRTLPALAERLDDAAARSALADIDRLLYGAEVDRRDARFLACAVRRVRRAMQRVQ